MCPPRAFPPERRARWRRARCLERFLRGERIEHLGCVRAEHGDDAGVPGKDLWERKVAMLPGDSAGPTEDRELPSVVSPDRVRGRWPGRCHVAMLLGMTCQPAIPRTVYGLRTVGKRVR